MVEAVRQHRPRSLDRVVFAVHGDAAEQAFCAAAGNELPVDSGFAMPRREMTLHRRGFAGHRVGDTRSPVGLDHHADPRCPGAVTTSTARCTTAITSPQSSPSITVNIASVLFGNPESRTTRTASATISPTLSPTPSGVTENATSTDTPRPYSRRMAASGACGFWCNGSRRRRCQSIGMSSDRFGRTARGYWHSSGSPMTTISRKPSGSLKSSGS